MGYWFSLEWGLAEEVAIASADPLTTEDGYPDSRSHVHGGASTCACAIVDDSTYMLTWVNGIVCHFHSRKVVRDS